MRERFPFDNGPNRQNVLQYDAYRDFCDQYDGLMRTGMCEPRAYKAVLERDDTMFAAVNDQEVPISTLRYTGEWPESVWADRNALIPVRLFPSSLRSGLVGIEQFPLDSEQVKAILRPTPGGKLKPADVPAIFQGRAQGELIDGHGDPQFMVLSRYDVSQCNEMKRIPPHDVITRGGHLLTTNKEKILAHLPELVELHQAVFKRQAVQIGYYDGLTAEMIDGLMRKDEFVGAAAFDKDTGKPFMFAIFGTGDQSMDQVPWINKRRVEEIIGNQADSALALPLVITAKFNGLSVFAETVSLAMHETMYRTQPDTTLSVLFSTNVQSILYTPRIIHAGTEQNGAVLQDCVIEASVLTRQS